MVTQEGRNEGRERRGPDNRWRKRVTKWLTEKA